MPKITKAGGPSYEGHVDVSSPATAAPEWQEAPAEPEAVEAPAEPVKPPAAADPKPTPRRRKS